MKKILLIGMLTLPLAGCFNYSDGERIGTVIKFSHKGIFCKTWEGELLLGGLKRRTDVSTDSNGETHSSTSMVANVFEFTVEDLDLVPKIREALSSGQPLKMTYKQELITFCRSDGNDSFITKVE